MKPTPELRRKIANLFMEYNESLDRTHATEEFAYICKSVEISNFMFVGHILNNAFSQDPQGWESIFSLVIEHFFLKEKILDAKQLVER